ncbi:telethonin [Polypterus senegalus]
MAKMFGRSVITKRAGRVTSAELGCAVSELNPSMKESYSMEWQDMVLSTRPEDRCSVKQKDTSRRESFQRQYEVGCLLQRSPTGVLRLGTAGNVREYQLPYRNVLPMPLFTPSDLGAKRHEPEVVLTPVIDGACPDKRAMSDITRDLPPVTQPARMDFTKMPRSLGRSMSQEAQRG